MVAATTLLVSQETILISLTVVTLCTLSLLNNYFVGPSDTLPVPAVSTGVKPLIVQVTTGGCIATIPLIFMYRLLLGTGITIHVSSRYFLVAIISGCLHVVV